MTRPKLHNEKSDKASGRPGAYSVAESASLHTDNSAEEISESPVIKATTSKKSMSDLESFLKSKKKQDKEPVRTISFRMPESLFQKFEELRNEMDMNRTDLLLYLVKFADETRTNA